MRWFIRGALCALLSCSCAAYAQSGADYLRIQLESPDGAAPAGIATAYQATAEAVGTLRRMGYASEVATSAAYLEAEDYDGTEYLARKILAVVDGGRDPSALLTALLTHQNADGGFGELPAHQSTRFDTALALEALTAAGSIGGDADDSAIAHLLEYQQPDGGWNRVNGDGEIYSTVHVVRALAPFRTQSASVTAALAAGNAFLLSQRQADGLWGEDFLSALSLIGIISSGAELSSYAESAQALQARQQSNGGWSDDVYTTALALRAVTLYSATAGGSGADVGTVTGHVYVAGTSEPLGNAQVLLASRPSTYAFTNADGYFVLSGVPAGVQTLTARKVGYASAGRSVAIQAAQTANAGAFYLAPGGQDGLVQGQVIDAIDNHGIAGATLTLAGTLTYQAVTASDGSFDLGVVEPGTYAITVSGSGYRTLNGQIDIAAATTTTVRQALTPENVYPDETPVALTGRVVDGTGGQALAGARLQLDDRQTVSGVDGSFTFDAVARGDHRLETSADGYQTRLYTFTLPPGASGDLGDLQLFALNDGQAPTALTLHGTVVDGLDGQPVAGAAATIVETGDTQSSDAAGQFTFSGVSTLSFNIALTAAGYEERMYQVTASGYGDLSQTFALPPAGGDETATQTTLSGVVLDDVSGQAITNATVTLSGSDIAAQTDASGAFEIAGIDTLDFTLTVSAAGYDSRTYPMQLAHHGAYNVELRLSPAAVADRFRIETLLPVTTGTGAGIVQRFAATVVNVTDVPQEAVIVADIIDGTGAIMSSVNPFAPETETPTALFGFQAGERVNLVIPWNPAQVAAGVYRVVLRLVESGSITRDLPTGRVLASAETNASVVDTPAIIGELGFEPPLVQAGSSQPVTLTALVLNNGNTPLSALPLTLSIRNPQSGAVLHSVGATVESLAVGNHVLVDFGQWVPSVAGDLPVSVAAAGVPGTVTGTLYVGDRATGTFTVDRSVVPLGTQDVHASVSLQGVDVRTGVSTDPLFFAVKEAIRKGAEYVAPAAMQWQSSNDCLGCHIQSQSFLGLAAAAEKAPVNAQAVQFLYNALAGSRRADGGIRGYINDYTKVQTALGMWSLAEWNDPREIFRTLYRASEHMLARATTAGSESYWTNDYEGGWWDNPSAMNMATVKGMSAMLRQAEALGDEPVEDYFLEEAQSIGNGRLVDFSEGPDGWVYFLEAEGTLYARNFNTGQQRTVTTSLPTTAFGIAVRGDGVIYVSSQSRLTRIGSNGTTTVLLARGSSDTLTDVVIGPDGMLYVADNNNARIWRVSDSGQASVFASGDLLYGPIGLAFDRTGNLLVTTALRTLLKVAPSGAISTVSRGFLNQPVQIVSSSDGGLYVSTRLDQTPMAILKVDEHGHIERIVEHSAQTNVSGATGFGVINGEIYVGNSDSKRLSRLRKRTLSTPKLDQVRAILPRVARYELNRYQDGTTYNLIQASRLMTLGEILKHTNDASLRAEFQAAMAHVADVLRQRQRPDGGWGKIVGWASDPLVTAAVGLALDYTNPSANDPVVRKTITFLLNKQLGDKSWSSPIFATRLGATSFVMAYLPLALDRFGGIDVDLHLSTPPNVHLSNPSIAPTSFASTADGGVAYHWFMRGVTASTRDIGFDLRLDDMAYQERRAVATEAWLGFHNSFTDEALRSDLEIPQVRAASDLALTLSTDQSTYPADAGVVITSRVDNVGPRIDYGNVELSIREPGSTATRVDLGRTGFGALDQNASLTMQSGWNTGSLPAGEYELYGRLYDHTGRLADEVTTVFSIVHPQPTLVAAVATDRAVYQAWDDVSLSSRVSNPTSNATQPPSRAELTVRTPAGEVIHQATYNVAQLAPGAQLNFPDTLRLADAMVGEYPVDLVVRDELTRTIVATASTRFAVERDALQGLSGAVRVEHTRVHQGDPNTCTDQIDNLSEQGLSGVTVVRSLVRLDSGETIGTSEEIVDFAGNERKLTVRSIDTEPLALGNYACVLAAKLDGRTRDLDSAGFLVIEPPIRIDAALDLGSRGRVLVLLDDGAPPASIEHTEPAYEAQRAYLEALLTREGWSYTIVTDPDAFAWELRSGDYSIYALFAEHAKLDEQVQKELREAVYRGEGLLDAGEHDQRHQKFDDALGIKPVGKHSGVVGVDLSASELSPATYADLQLKDKALRATPTTASSFGRYVGVAADPLAVAALDYGRGRSVYMGFDLLAEAALAGNDSVFEQLIIRSLSHVEPEFAPAGAGRVVPIRVTLNNGGIATPGRALLGLPAGVTVVDRGESIREDDQLVWSFELAEEQTLQFTVWLRLPEAEQVSFELLVQSGVDPNLEDRAQTSLDLALEQQPGLDAARQLANANQDFKEVRTWLDKAAVDIEAGKHDAALANLVKASDEVLKRMSRPRASELRLMIDEALVRVGRLL